mgnify:CR=1 FL=1
MLIDIDKESTAPGNNPNNPDCLCDVEDHISTGHQCQHNQECQNFNNTNIDKWVITIEHHVNNDASNKEGAIKTLVKAFSTILKKLK